MLSPSFLFLFLFLIFTSSMANEAARVPMESNMAPENGAIRNYIPDSDNMLVSRPPPLPKHGTQKTKLITLQFLHILYGWVLRNWIYIIFSFYSDRDIRRPKIAVAGNSARIGHPSEATSPDLLSPVLDLSCVFEIFAGFDVARLFLLFKLVCCFGIRIMLWILFK